MAPKIGVYVCHCGTNIAATVDVVQVTEFARGLSGVTVAREYKYMCSDPGQALIKNDIRELGLDRVVVASCSPRLHEPTFRRTCQDAGLNQYLFEMANIREHCSWVHDGHDEATEKARALISAAVRRVALNQPLESREVPVTRGMLVVGGGIAGIQAALEVADSGCPVCLVEREPSIGGHMAQFDKTFPTLDCAACILTPKMTMVGQHPFINLLAHSQVEEVSGYVGNFKVKIRKKARFVNHRTCTGCGTCWQKCPERVTSEFDVGRGKRTAIYIPFAQAVPNKPVIDAEHCRYMKYRAWEKKPEGKKPPECRICEKLCPTKSIDWDQQDEIITQEFGAIVVATGYQAFDPSPLKQYGYGRYANVVTGLEMERMLNSSGPTGGKVLLKNGSQPQSVGILHCVGSRDKNYHEYCSRVCCMSSMKFSHLIGEKTGAKVYEFYIDLRPFGKGYEEFYNRVLHEGTIFIRGRVAEVTDVAETPAERGKLIIQCEDTLIGKQRRIPVDMVLLNSALEAQADAVEVARMFSLSVGKDGFFIEKHPKLDPVATMTDGVFIAGCAQGPKDIPDSVAQGAAAAARALAMITRGKVQVEAATAVVDEALCAGCKTCIAVCPYKAIGFDEAKKVSAVNEALCKGCGTCAAACPSGAITSRHFTTDQIMAQIEGVLV